MGGTARACDSKPRAAVLNKTFTINLCPFRHDGGGATGPEKSAQQAGFWAI
jgi:hypothetical protein